MPQPVPLRQKLLSGGVGGVISGPHNTDLVDYIGQLGLDGVWLEGEHGPIDWDAIGDFTRACDLWNMASITRVAVGEPWIITRTLDRGASGIVVPHVSNGEVARRVGEASRFGPLGLRGMYSGRRSYGADNYYQRANDEVLVVVLIEEIEAVQNLDAILEEERIDVFFVAPSDLAQTMGHTGNHGHPEVQRTIDDAIARIVRAGRIAGTLVTDENRERYLDQGVRFTMTSWLPWLVRGATAFRDSLAERKG